MASLGTGGKQETTEWDDILRQKGILPEKTIEELAKERVDEMVATAVDRYDPHASKTVEQLDDDLNEEELDSDEERLILSYRERRIAEMRENMARPRFGPGLPRIGAHEWKDEITNAPQGVFVIVLLVVDGSEDCKIMANALIQLSAQFRFVKMVQCKSTDAIKNYPDSKCPTLLIYRDGAIFKQYVGLKAFAGKRTDAADLEWTLSTIGVLETALTEKPMKEFSMTRA